MMTNNSVNVNTDINTEVKSTNAGVDTILSQKSETATDIDFQIYDCDFPTPEKYSRKAQNKKEYTNYALKLRKRAGNAGFKFPTETGTDKLIATLNNGLSVHFCITSSSCKAEDVDYVSGCFADYDGMIKGENKEKKPHPNVATIEELLNCPTIQKYCAFYQESFSGSPNYHFHFRYGKRLDYKSHKKILTIINERLNLELKRQRDYIFTNFDPSVNTNSTHLCFAGKKDCALIPGRDDGDYGDFIPVDDWLTIPDEIAIQPQTQNNANSSSEDGITLVWLKDIKTRIVDEILDGQWWELFTAFDHKFSPRGLNQYEGLNPFTNNTSGSSFTITNYNDDLPPCWFSRSGFKNPEILDSINNKESGNILQYWLLVARQKSLEGEETWLDNYNTSKQFIGAYKEICKYFGIKPLNRLQVREDSAKSLTSVATELLADLKEVLYLAEWGENSKNPTIYFYYMNGNNFFKEVCLNKIVPNLVSKILKKYPNFDRQQFEINPKWKGLTRELANWLKNVDLSQHLKTLYQRPKWDKRYLPFNNGLYDVTQKHLIPNDGRSFNTGVISFDYREVSPSNYGVMAFKKWIRDWMQLPVKSDYLLNYSIICAQGRANEVATFPCIYGERGQGKSTFGATLAHIIRDNGFNLVLANSKTFLREGNHSEASIENKFLITCEEIGQRRGYDLDKLLGYFGKADSDQKIEINPKNQEVREIDKLFGLIADSEKIPQLPKGKGGYFRRFAFLESSYCPEALHLIEIVKKYKEDIFCWLLQQDFKEAKDRINDCINDDYFKKQIEKVERENSELSVWFEDKIILTNDEKRIHSSTLYDCYRNWCDFNGERPLSSRQFLKYFTDLLKSHGWKLDKTTKYKSNSGYTFVGIEENTANIVDIKTEVTPQEPTPQEPTPQEPTPQEPTPQEPTPQEVTEEVTPQEVTEEVTPQEVTEEVTTQEPTTPRFKVNQKVQFQDPKDANRRWKRGTIQEIKEPKPGLFDYVVTYNYLEKKEGSWKQGKVTITNPNFLRVPEVA